MRSRRRSDFALGVSLEAEELLKGTGAYNLACVEARLGNAPEAVSWLKASAAAGKLPVRAVIAAEKDFDQIRGEREFVDFESSIDG